MRTIKQKVSLVVSIFMVTVLFISCTTEVPFATEESADADIQIINYSSSSGRNPEKTLLSFSSYDVFKNTINQLEMDIIAHDDAFINQWPNLDADGLSDKEQEVGFDMYKPLKDFLASHNFNESMVSDYISAEKEWLNQPELDESTSPESSFYDLEEEELTVLNSDGVVKIGNSLFKVFKNGHIEITDGDFKTLELFKNVTFLDCDITIILGNENIKALCNGGGGGGGGGGNFCFSDERDESNWQPENRRKIRGIIKAVYSPGLWGVKLKSKTKYYKKVAGIWWLRRTDLTAALDGKVDVHPSSDCGDLAVEYDENIHFKHETNRATVKYRRILDPNTQKFLVKNNKIKGVHKRYNDRREHFLNN